MTKSATVERGRFFLGVLSEPSIAQSRVLHAFFHKQSSSSQLTITINLFAQRHVKRTNYYCAMPRRPTSLRSNNLISVESSKRKGPLRETSMTLGCTPQTARGKNETRQKIFSFEDGSTCRDISNLIRTYVLVTGLS